MYESDVTRFLNELKQSKPELEREQRQGRALLWDREPVDLEEVARLHAAHVPQRGYVYQTSD
ncbi:MAG: DUF3460 family protein [Burkholderiales bacterium]|nr:MAG: DUF3460 family protein [Burkholderiales bacterium]